MEKGELVKQIFKKTGIPEFDISMMLDAFSEVIVEQSVSRETISCKGFGRIYYAKRKERIVKHKGKTFKMESKWVAKFRISDNIQREINEKTKSADSQVHKAPSTFEEARAAYLKLQANKG